MERILRGGGRKGEEGGRGRMEEEGGERREEEGGGSMSHFLHWPEQPGPLEEHIASQRS